MWIAIGCTAAALALGAAVPSIHPEFGLAPDAQGDHPMRPACEANQRFLSEKGMSLILAASSDGALAFLQVCGLLRAVPQKPVDRGGG